MWPFRSKAHVLPRVAAIELGPSDRLVMETPIRLSPDIAKSVRQDLADVLGIDVSRVLIVQNATLKILREGEPPPPPVTLSPGVERIGI